MSFIVKYILLAYFIHNNWYLSNTYSYVAGPPHQLVTPSLFCLFLSLLLFVIVTSWLYFSASTYKRCHTKLLKLEIIACLALHFSCKKDAEDIAGSQ